MSFYYVDGDRNKTPVSLDSLRPGTAAVFVNDEGRDLHFIVGKKIVNDPAAQRARFTAGAASMAAHRGGEN